MVVCVNKFYKIKISGEENVREINRVFLKSPREEIDFLFMKYMIVYFSRVNTESLIKSFILEFQ